VWVLTKPGVTTQPANFNTRWVVWPLCGVPCPSHAILLSRIPIDRHGFRAAGVSRENGAFREEKVEVDSIRESKLGLPYRVVPSRAVLRLISALSSSCLAGRSQHGTHGAAGPAHVLAERVREPSVSPARNSAMKYSCSLIDSSQRLASKLASDLARRIWLSRAAHVVCSTGLPASRRDFRMDLLVHAEIGGA